MDENKIFASNLYNQVLEICDSGGLAKFGSYAIVKMNGQYYAGLSTHNQELSVMAENEECIDTLIDLIKIMKERPILLKDRIISTFYKILNMIFQKEECSFTALADIECALNWKKEQLEILKKLKG